MSTALVTIDFLNFQIDSKFEVGSLYHRVYCYRLECSLFFFSCSIISIRVQISIVYARVLSAVPRETILTFGRAGHELVMPPYPTYLASLNVLHCSQFMNSTRSYLALLSELTDFANYVFVLTS